MKRLVFLLSLLLLFPSVAVSAPVLEIKETRVIAVISEASGYYRDRGFYIKAGDFPAGERVEIIKDYSESRYFVRSMRTDKSGWVRRESLDIPPDTPANETRLTAEQLEEYVNNTGFFSDTNYFILTDIDRQLVHVFNGSTRSWSLLKTMDCATGKNTSPTTRGLFKTGERGEWFYSERLGSGGMYWVRFNGPYLFHSIPMDKDKNVLDDTIGVRCSNGCIRLRISDAKWIFKTIPDGTGVFVT